MSMKLEIEISDEQIEELLVSAFEGGCNYWMAIKCMYNKIDARKEPYMPSAIMTVMSENGVLEIEVLEDKNKPRLMLTKFKLHDGLRIMANKHHQYFADILINDTDTTTADVFIQCALFGDIIYGY